MQENDSPLKQLHHSQKTYGFVLSRGNSADTASPLPYPQARYAYELYANKSRSVPIVLA